MKIMLEQYGEYYMYQSKNEDNTADEVLDVFKKLMVGAGYQPSILDDEDGRWEYVRSADTVLSREELDSIRSRIATLQKEKEENNHAG